jgi:malonyl-CoA/methylmalonyl-CoA synthetase
MVSGSAALPVSTLIAGRKSAATPAGALRHDGDWDGAFQSVARRTRAGQRRTPLPGVEVQLVGENGRPVAPGTPGEIEVRGPSVFTEYWGQPERHGPLSAMDGFARAILRSWRTAVYRILGRTNIDILKTGGHKVSALEIEEALRSHPAIAECAVVGIPDSGVGRARGCGRRAE